MPRPSYFSKRLFRVLPSFCIYFMFLLIHTGRCNADLWPLERPEGMPSIQSLEVMCGKDHMDVHLTFSQPFEGLVSSKGQHGDPRCIYVPPSSGQTFFSFRIAYARCGTKPDLHGQFYENTVVVQYDKDLLEVWDEAKRLRCEWFNDYEKTASKPPMVIADLDVIQLDFRGDNVDCWMEIQHGKGPWAPPVSGIVPLGSTLTLVVAINDYRGEFDMRVKSCVASDGGGHVIQLSDEFGCVLRPKMISRFLKARGADERASVITYAFFHAFKFPDALSVHIKCKVEICRHGCLDHCQLQPDGVAGDVAPDHVQSHYANPLERKDVLSEEASEDRHSALLIKPVEEMIEEDEASDQEDTSEEEDDESEEAHYERSPDPPKSSQQSVDDDDMLYDDIISERESDKSQSPVVKMSFSGSANNGNHNERMPQPMMQLKRKTGGLTESASKEEYVMDMEGMQDNDKEISPVPLLHEKFPHGPRNLEKGEDRSILASPRSLGNADTYTLDNNKSEKKNVDSYRENSTLKKKAPERRKRNVVVSDRKARSADVGVSGLYEVISEADLAFSPDSRAEAVAVFQGRIREEVVYGICMPVPGFSVLFVLVAVSAVVSALVAGSLLYRYQLQKEHLAESHHSNGIIPNGPISTWVNLKILRPRHHHNQQVNGKSKVNCTDSNGKIASEEQIGNSL